MPFLAEPRIDQVLEMSGERCRKVLTAGVQVRTQDAQGLRLVAHKVIGIAIGEPENIEAACFLVSTSMARGWATRMFEMCDEVERNPGAV